MARISKSKEVKVEPQELPALTIDEREDQLIALAMGLAEERLRDKTASNDLVRSIIQYGSTRARLEKEKIKRENDLLVAKVKAIESAREISEMYDAAIKAMRSYSGEDSSDDEEDSDIF